MICSLLSLFSILPLLVDAQITLPILPEPRFNLRSAESIVLQQLGSWGVNLTLSLHLPVLSSVDLGVAVQPSVGEVRSVHNRSLEVAGGHIRRSRSRERDLSLGLGAGIGVSTGGSGSLGVGTGSLGEVGKTVGSIIGGVLPPSNPPTRGWGQADNVAKGEQGDQAWFTYISVGTPPLSIPITPDTGSSDLYVFGPTCTTCYLSNHTAYTPSSSSSFQNLTSPWTLYYADGSAAKGYSAADTISFGSDSHAIQTGLNFGVATRIGGTSFDDSVRSGVMGLSLDGMATMPGGNGTKGLTLFSRFVKGGMLKENVLSIRLDKGVQSQGVVYEEGSGAYTFGGVEEGYIVGGRGGLGWAPVTSANYWGLAMDDISVGSVSILKTDTITPKRAIIDTGTTLIITSDEAATAIHALIPSSFQSKTSGIWYIPCSTSYPLTGNIFFTIGGVRYGVPIVDIAWKVSDTYEGQCVSGVQGGLPYFTVLGDMFIKNRYIVLSYGDQDQNNLQIGLGNRLDVPLIL